MWVGSAAQRRQDQQTRSTDLCLLTVYIQLPHCHRMATEGLTFAASFMEGIKWLNREYQPCLLFYWEVKAFPRNTHPTNFHADFLNSVSPWFSELKGSLGQREPSLCLAETSLNPLPSQIYRMPLAWLKGRVWILDKQLVEPGSPNFYDQHV